jgi:hypothetical protein
MDTYRKVIFPQPLAGCVKVLIDHIQAVISEEDNLIYDLIEAGWESESDKLLFVLFGANLPNDHADLF